MTRVFIATDFPAQVVGIGSMFCIHMTRKRPIRDTRDYVHYDHAQSKKMFSFLLERGIVILLPEIMHGGISFAHTEEDIDISRATIRLSFEIFGVVLGAWPEAFHRLIRPPPEDYEVHFLHQLYREPVDLLVHVVPGEVVVWSFEITIQAQHHGKYYFPHLLSSSYLFHDGL